MWIETQDGDLVNSAYVKRLWLCHKSLMVEFADGGLVKIAEYNDENERGKAVEEFKTKLRRCGEKIFKFFQVKESEENEKD